MRVFIGMYNIANLMSIYSQGFRSLGFDVDCYEFTHHPFYELETRKVNFYGAANRVLSENNSEHPLLQPYYDDGLLDKLEIIISDQLSYDIYIFMNCMSLLPGNLDFPIIKRKNKIIISLFSGSEVRHSISAKEIWSTMDNTLPDIMAMSDSVVYNNDPIAAYRLINADVYERSIDKKIQNICMAEIFSDVILSVPEQSGLQLRPYQAYVHAVDPNSLKSKIPNRRYPIVSHVPSNPAVKRSELILKALDELAREGVKYTLIAKSRIPHSEVIDILSESDILVDQISNFPALLSHEAMASGCAVLTGRHELSMPIPLIEERCPAVHITTKTLKDRLRETIQNRAQRFELSTQGIDYIMAICTPQSAAVRLINAVERAMHNDYDYFPMWNHIHLQETINRLTDYAKILMIESINKNGRPAECTDLDKYKYSNNWSYQINHIGGWTYCRELKK